MKGLDFYVEARVERKCLLFATHMWVHKIPFNPFMPVATGNTRLCW